MSIAKEFIEAIERGDLTLVRTMIKNSMVSDPTFNEFNELRSYAEKNIDELYEEHDGDGFVTDSSSWDKSYMNKQLNNLMYNFSKERINHLKKVCGFVYSDRIKSRTSKMVIEEKSEIKVTGTRSIAKTAVVGGVGVAVAGFFLEKTILMAGGALIAIAGGVILLSNKDK